jgi:hypothetical protein
VVRRRTARPGPDPVLEALVRDDASSEIRGAGRIRLVRRMVKPVAARLNRQPYFICSLYGEMDPVGFLRMQACRFATSLFVVEV